MDKELKKLIEKEIISQNEIRIKEARADILWLEFLIEKGKKELEELNKKVIILPNQTIDKIIKERTNKKVDIEKNLENLEKVKKAKEKTIEIYKEYTNWLKKKLEEFKGRNL
jgi:hypothetical protein